MSHYFRNDITIPSSSYDFYMTDGFVPVESNIQCSFTVAADEEIKFNISKTINTLFECNFNAIAFGVISTTIPINATTQASASIGLVNIPVTPSAINLIFNTKLYSIDRFSNSITEDSFNIKPFFILDDIPLSEHNRVTSVSTQLLNTSAVNWRGNKSVYYKQNGLKRNFTIQWKMLPGKRDNTVDSNMGRNYVKEKALDPRSHVLEIRNIDSNGVTPYTTQVYNVLISEYNETLIRRDLIGDEYYWDCSVTMQEV